MTIHAHEVATIDVNGTRYDLWELVYVRDSWRELWPIFRFTAAERDPIPDLWDRIQLRPKDRVTIILGGHHAIENGIILLRQTAYDANAHGVMLSGVGRPWSAARSGIESKDSNFDNMNLVQVARKVCAPFGVPVTTIGAVNPMPFKRLNCEQGVPIGSFIEPLARFTGTVLGSTYRGELLLVGQHEAPIVDTLVEGHNILRCQATISIEDVWTKWIVKNSSGGTDGHSGPAASAQQGVVAAPAALGGMHSVKIWTAEYPVWTQAQLQERANHEAKWDQGTEITVQATVQGWLKPTGGLWRAGQNVQFKSAMALLHDITLKVQTATFTQDSSSGTLTQLELVAPWMLNDRGKWDVGKPNAPQPPPPAAPQTTPPAAPTSVPAPTPDTAEDTLT